MTLREKIEECARHICAGDFRDGSAPDWRETADAIKKLIEEDRKTRECCKAEREACKWIVECEIGAIESVTMDGDFPPEGWGECCIERCTIIKNHIEARS